jgi:hypothetical protein
LPKIIKCSVCGEKSPRLMGFGDRMRWLKKHYKERHPSKSRAQVMRVKNTDKK